MCHGNQLSNGMSNVPLKGPAFMKKYGGHTAAELFTLVSRTMPPANPGSLDPATYAALIAYLLQENAIVAGETPLPSDPKQLARMNVPETGFSFMAFSRTRRRTS